MNAKDDCEYSGFQAMAEICPHLAEELTALKQSPGGLIGLSTGYRRLDQLTRGLRAGQLIVIAARPSMGKTTLALNIASYIALYLTTPRPVGFFSLDSGALQLALRIVADLSKTRLWQLINGTFSDNDWPGITNTIEKLAKAPLYINDQPTLTVAELCDQSRKLKHEHPDLGLVVIDNLQLIQENHNYKDKATHPADISGSLKSLAKEIGVPVIVLSQLSRDAEQRQDHRPAVSDLRSYGRIAQDADIILLIYRDEVYNPDSSRPREADIMVARNRTGDTNSFVLSFEGQFARFANLPQFLLPEDMDFTAEADE